MKSLILSGLSAFFIILVLPIIFDLRRMRHRPIVKSGGEMVQDPACQVYLPKAQALRRAAGGEVHYFCSEACVQQFDRATKPVGAKPADES